MTSPSPPGSPGVPPQEPGALAASSRGGGAADGPGVDPSAADDATALRRAVRDGVGVGVAVGLSGFAFGVTSSTAGLSVWQTCALSLFVFTGASQFALVAAVAGGGSPWTAALGALVLGVRNGLYGLRLSTLLRLRGAGRAGGAHWVIDETTVVALAQPGARSARRGFLVTGATVFTLWNLTTLLGALGTARIGDPADWGLDAAGPAVFLALLVPMLRGATERATAVIAVGLVLLCLPLLPAGVPVLVAASAAPLALAAHRLLRGGSAPAAGGRPERSAGERGGGEP